MPLVAADPRPTGRDAGSGILEDAAAAHRNSIPLVTDGGGAAHEEAASLIETILKGGNSVRHA
jgi:hypothetical protein